MTTTLYAFGNSVIKGKLRHLSEVRSLKNENSEGWLKFSAHALNFYTPPYLRTLDQNLSDFQNIFQELVRISGDNISRSIRLHYYSECYEMMPLFERYGVKELFTTDKPIVAYRLPEIDRTCLARNGTHLVKGLQFTSTHLRVEDFANHDLTRSEIYERFSNIMKATDRLVLYSHEYEHTRDLVRKKLFESIEILSENLGLESTW